MKQIKFLILVVLALLVAACSCCKDSGEQQSGSIISGEIYITGNEPFTKVAIRVDEKTSYIVSADKETLQMLRSKQGVVFDIEYKEIKKTPEGRIIVVEKILMKNNNSN